LDEILDRNCYPPAKQKNKFVAFLDKFIFYVLGNMNFLP